MARLDSMERDAALYAWDGKVLRGKDGWLFLAHDSNDVLLQQTGELRFSPRQLEDWRLLLESRTAWCETLGAHYSLLVPPNAHSVYPEKLPDEIESAPDRPVMQLLGHLQATGSFARLVYPLDELLEEKGRMPVYAKTETHWNDLGAFVGYSALANEVSELAPLRRLALADIELEEQLLPGDLGYKVTPQERSMQLLASPREPRARVVSDNCVLNNGAIVDFECSDAPSTTCVVFGDSFALRPLIFLVESFRRLVFAHHTPLDFELVREIRPDVVIGILNERFIWRIPYDLPAPSVREVAREREAQGRLRKPLSSVQETR